jgi:glycosyltransferase involved in cell wall biosynthesis
VKVAAVIPAYNEEARLPRVLQILSQTDCLHEILVANDGSTDRTAETAAQFPNVRVINLPRNKGKGGAMFAGATATDADVIVFFDADLIGLQPAHVSALVEPIINEGYVMAIGVFRGGRWSTDVAQILAPNISGQRALRREIFLEVPGIEAARSGVEIALTLHVKRKRYPVAHIVLEGITHTMKEEKLGKWRGTVARWKMYREIFKAYVRYSRLGQLSSKLLLRKQESD